MKTPASKTCPRCQQQFRCDIACGQDTCWCFEFPKVLPLVENAECFCPDCLQKEISARAIAKKEEPPQIEDGSL
ncbi:MAG: cysteine-rich CWC family protein [Planctomycetaceae bacterium]|nr:cysteine-rich CWC family protein [Planctomycetaceae bacterium]